MSDTFVFPASSVQRRFWLLQASDPADVAYNVPAAYRIRGPFDLAALDRAVAAVAARHDALRTTFEMQDGELVQVIHADAAIGATAEGSVANLDEPLREAEARRAIAAEIHRPFDLARGPLLRTMFVRTSPEAGILVLTIHHVVCDGWALGILLDEIGTCYNAERQHAAVNLPALAIQYPDYTIWQRDIETQRRDDDFAYWQRRLAGAPAALDVPPDFVRPAHPTGGGTRAQFPLPAEVVNAVRAIGTNAGATLFMTLLAAFQVLLRVYTEQDDMLVASPVAGRNDASLQPLVGCFVNTLALRGDLSGDPTFPELLGRTRQSTVDAFAHEDLPFDVLVNQLHPERTASRAPLCQVAFVLDQTPPALPAFEGLAIEAMPLWTETAKFDLMLTIAQDHSGWIATWEYRTDLFEAATIARLAEHYVRVLGQIAAAPDRRLSDFDLLPPDERHRLLVEWNATQQAFPRDRTIHELFDAQVDRTPEAVALVCGDDTWTYAALRAASRRRADALRASGATRGDVIGVRLDRSSEAIATLIAVLDVRAAYVPLDPSWSAERTRFVLEDAGARVVVTPRGVESAAAIAGRDVVPVTWTAGDPAGDDVAYLMYTSGSTGEPKAVAVAHRGIARLVVGNRDVEFTRADRVLHASPLTFDASTFEIWGALLNGATLVVVTERQPSLRALAATIEHHGVSVAWFTADLFQQMVDAHLESVRLIRRVLTGGDVVSPAHARRVLESRSNAVINGYGPTENTTFTTCWRMSSPDDVGPTVSIGRPIANTTAYVLDARRRPVPVGVPGELYTGGAGVARGYWRRPSLTAERFVADPFDQSPGATLYRTGDRVRYRPDGRLEFLGRVDRQIKIRGFRVELEEIEAALAKCPDVSEAVVDIHASPGGKRLVAYVVPDRPGVSTSALASQLGSVLPDYMVPSLFVTLETLPRTTAGKIDRRALPAPDETTPRHAGSVVAPRTPVEELLRALWAEVLHTDANQIGVDDDFFSIGGHSLIAMQLVGRIHAVFGCDLPIRAIFEARTIAALAARVSLARPGAREAASASDPVPVARPSPLPLSFAQRQLWFLDRLETTGSSYHVDLGWRLEGELNVRALADALSAVVARHEALRTVFPSTEGVPEQVVRPAEPVTMREIDLRGDAPETRPAALARIAKTEGGRPFDLAKGPLLRATLVRLDEADHALTLTLHHIICDGWSVDLISRELSELYAAGVAARPAALAPVALQHADYTIWQRRQLESGAWEGDRSYWSQQLAGAPTLDLPSDRPRPGTRTTRGGRVSRTLAADRARTIDVAGRSHGVTLHMMLLAAFGVLIALYSDSKDVVIGSPMAGRSRLALEHLVGFLANVLALRVSLAGDPTVAELLGRVREVTLDAYAHADLPFEALVEGLHLPRDASRTPLFQAMLVVQSRGSSELALPGIHSRVVPIQESTSKFDLLVAARESDDSLQLDLEYNADLFDRETADRLIDRLATILDAFTVQPATPISQLNVMSDDERRLVVDTWNDTASDYPRHASIHELFAAEAAARPDEVAVIQGERRETRRWVDAQASLLAQRLRRAGVGPGDVAGVCCARSPEMVVALLAILKAGAAYLPLSPRDPIDRQVFVLRDAGARVLVTEPALAGAIREKAPEIAAIDVREIDASPGELDATAPVSGESLAYIMYTSGSTGQPKGVAVPHRAVVRLVYGVDRLSGRPLSRFLQLSPLAFDASTFDLWVPLLRGGCCVLFDGDEIPSPDAIAQHIRRHDIGCLWLTAAFFNTIVDARPDALTGVRDLFVGGETLSPAHIARAQRALPGVRLINGYGPTEGTTFTCCHVIDRPCDEATPIPIGRPLGNTRVLVLDDHGQVVPIGVPGELHISGDGLAHGYWKQPALTAQKFVAHPLAGPPGGLLYKTGDRARWRADGTIDFLGREDRQIKLRGFRIELEEIETQLGRHPGVGQAVVDVRRDAADSVLEAFVVPAHGARLEAADLHAFLEERLPGYMVPSRFAVLETLPLTPNGKIDRAALPDLPAMPAGKDRPVSQTERRLATIWTQTLGAAPHGVDEDFFEAGGHSLLAVAMLARVETAFGVTLPISALFHAPTISLLARAIEDAAPVRRRVLVPIQAGGDGPAIVFVHALGGEVWNYVPLARRLAPDWRSFGLQLPEFDAGSRFPDVEALASIYVEALEREVPGPYVIAGYSSGATIGFEIARQLRARGADVQLLVALDGGLPNRGPAPGGWRPLARGLVNLLHWTRYDLLVTTPSEMASRVRAKLSSVTKGGLSFHLRDERGAPVQPPAGFSRHHAAVFSYQPHAFDGRVMVVKALARPLLGPFEADLGWRRMVSGPVTVVPVPGSHETFLREPYVRAVAEAIRRELRRAK
ncbi:MAG TPA: amino acid adenylation domain-containing protein [Vicinamibacterales bacterium]|nr:amino acid adenylation domain-containing protein [Vicinamibacterales bacterium]